MKKFLKTPTKQALNILITLFFMQQFRSQFKYTCIYLWSWWVIGKTQWTFCPSAQSWRTEIGDWLFYQSLAYAPVICNNIFPDYFFSVGWQSHTDGLRTSTVIYVLNGWKSSYHGLQWRWHITDHFICNLPIFFIKKCTSKETYFDSVFCPKGLI